MFATWMRSMKRRQLLHTRAFKGVNQGVNSPYTIYSQTHMTAAYLYTNKLHIVDKNIMLHAIEVLLTMISLFIPVLQSHFLVNYLLHFLVSDFPITNVQHYI